MSQTGGRAPLAAAQSRQRLRESARERRGDASQFHPVIARPFRFERRHSSGVHQPRAMRADEAARAEGAFLPNFRYEFTKDALGYMVCIAGRRRARPHVAQ